MDQWGYGPGSSKHWHRYIHITWFHPILALLTITSLAMSLGYIANVLECLHLMYTVTENKNTLVINFALLLPFIKFVNIFVADCTTSLSDNGQRPYSTDDLQTPKAGHDYYHRAYEMRFPLRGCVHGVVARLSERERLVTIIIENKFNTNSIAVKIQGKTFPNQKV